MPFKFPIRPDTPKELFEALKTAHPRMLEEATRQKVEQKEEVQATRKEKGDALLLRKAYTPYG